MGNSKQNDTTMQIRVESMFRPFFPFLTSKPSVKSEVDDLTPYLTNKKRSEIHVCV